MTVNAQVVVEARRYSGWNDPRYPIGFWQAALAVTGDASGGLLGIDLVFQPATSPALNSQMYSVERFAISSALQEAQLVRVSGVNMSGPSNRGFLLSYGVQMDVVGGNIDSRVLGDQFSFLPLFLGSQRSPGTTASFSLLTNNSLGIEYLFEAEGYRWSPRSVLVDGGPQRPPTGLYQR